MEVAKKDPRDIAIGGLLLTATGIGGKIAKPPSIDEYRAAMAFIDRASGASNWWKGDLAIMADTWGDEYVQLLQEMEIDENSLRVYRAVAANVSHVTRVANLPWSYHRSVAGLEAKDQKRLLAMAQPKAGERTPRLTRAELDVEVRKLRLEHEQENHPLPDGTYRVLLADPPWKYADELIEGYGAAEHHYPTLSIDELCELKDAKGKSVRDLAQPDSVLFMWATSPLLDDAFRVIESWGFTYKTSFVWDKVKHNYGHYNSVRHELLLVCTRGSCTPDNSTLRDSVVECERDDKHSRKPEVFYEIIEEMYTQGPRIELFARESRKGWKAWGNEVKA